MRVPRIQYHLSVLRLFFLFILRSIPSTTLHNTSFYFVPFLLFCHHPTLKSSPSPSISSTLVCIVSKVPPGYYIERRNRRTSGLSDGRTGGLRSSPPPRPSSGDRHMYDSWTHHERHTTYNQTHGHTSPTHLFWKG